jgi:hypothetical protein
VLLIPNFRKTNEVGRSPWTAADAPVGLVSSRRRSRADEGVPTPNHVASFQRQNPGATMTKENCWFARCEDGGESDVISLQQVRFGGQQVSANLLLYQSMYSGRQGLSP